MLTKKQIDEIREHLNKSQNPVFFFDNDADGLASFLLLRRYIDRGRGVAIRSFPDLNASYARKVYELNADYIFVLDKPQISEGFISEAAKANIPLVWIDHHNTERNSKEIYVYNPLHDKESSSEPVSYWAYNILNKKEDLWIAMIGCIGDGFFPEFTNEFRDKYPELWGNVDTAFQGLYETNIGKITRILGFALKDRTSNVVKMLKFLVKVKSPSALLEENKDTIQIARRFNQVEKSYRKLLDKAKIIGIKKTKLLYFQYGGQLSLSADLANELFYLFPEKIIVVAYLSGVKANVSLRGGIDMTELTKEAIKGLENSTGGGHLHATGAQVQIEDLPKFKEKIESLVK